MRRGMVEAESHIDCELILRLKPEDARFVADIIEAGVAFVEVWSSLEVPEEQLKLTSYMINFLSGYKKRGVE